MDDSLPIEQQQRRTVNTGSQTEQTNTNIPVNTVSQTSRKSGSWKLFGHNVPSKEVAFFVQCAVILIVLVSGVINLSVGGRETELWKFLLCSIIGYILPTPSMTAKKEDG